MYKKYRIRHMKLVVACVCAVLATMVFMSLSGVQDWYWAPVVVLLCAMLYLTMEDHRAYVHQRDFLVTVYSELGDGSRELAECARARLEEYLAAEYRWKGG